MTSPNPLEPLLQHMYPGFDDERWEKLLCLVNGSSVKGQLESAITETMCALHGPLGRSLANIFLEIYGEDHCEHAEMIGPWCFAYNKNRSPDIGVYDASNGRTLLLAECKGGASINYGRCPRDYSLWSSQIICYPHGCWAYQGKVNAAKFLWIYPDGANPWKGGWDERHRNIPKYLRDAGNQETLDRWIDSELEARNSWHTATWDDVAVRIRSLDNKAAEVLARIIENWLAGGGLDRSKQIRSADSWIPEAAAPQTPASPGSAVALPGDFAVGCGLPAGWRSLPPGGRGGLSGFGCRGHSRGETMVTRAARDADDTWDKSPSNTLAPGP
jgi:hypothetical protein